MVSGTALKSTAIEWTDATWNPTTGCSKVSPGCAHCYAETLSLRHGWSKKPWTPENAAENVVLHEDRLLKPLSWREPRMVFVNSMSDLFHEQIPFEFIDMVFGVMWQASRHTFQVLTKRPERAREYLNRVPTVSIPDPQSTRLGRSKAPKGYVEWIGRTPHPWPLPNVWIGTSIENMRHAYRADALRETNAAVRFISAEPLLGPLVEWMVCPDCGGDGSGCEECQDIAYWPLQGASLELHDIDWLIVGGESGPGHRPMKAEWARDLRDLAAMYPDTAFFFKQWGGRTPKAGGRELDGRTWDEYPVVAT